jgi:hypothetical protein
VYLWLLTYDELKLRNQIYGQLSVLTEGFLELVPPARQCFVIGAVAELVGIDGGVVSGVFNLESSGVEASDWRPRHEEQYHEA